MSTYKNACDEVLLGRAKRRKNRTVVDIEQERVLYLILLLDQGFNEDNSKLTYPYFATNEEFRTSEVAYDYLCSNCGRFLNNSGLRE